MKSSVIIFCVSLVLMSACSNLVEGTEPNSYELVERWYKTIDGEETLFKEIYWEDFDREIKFKEVEYDQFGGIIIEIYSDSLLRTEYMIDNSESIDTFLTIRYNYDKYENIISYLKIEDNEEHEIKCELVLDPETKKPISRKVITPNSFSITKIEYSPYSEVSSTYEGDSLVLYTANYFDKQNRKTSLARYHLMFTPSMSDSTCYEYEKEHLIREVKYFNDTLSGHKTYYYENDTLRKVIDKPKDKDETIYVIKYSKK